jgi:anti-anti-sigma regulatory factor
MAKQHEKTIEALEAELRACEGRIFDLEQRVADQSRPTTSPPLAIDIAVRDQLRADLEQQSLELHIFKRLADQSRGALCITGMDRRIRYANVAFRSMTGFGDQAIGAFTWEFLDEGEADRDGVYVDYRAEDDDQLLVDRDQVIGRRLEDLLPPDVAARIKALLREAIATRRPQSIEYSLDLRGERHDLEGKAVACSDDLVVITARDVTERKRAEEERRALQAEVIAAKDTALRELATPIVPIADGVIAMPLIGAIDPVRAQQILEALLAGIAAHRLRVAILDVTGVKVVDAEIASALVRAAKAARLLGARVVLTGIGPQVAQTLVELQADLGGIITYGTLQAGIAYALRR